MKRRRSHFTPSRVFLTTDSIYHKALAEICRATGVIVLDQDLVVLRNIDHLSGAPTPGVVMQHSPSFAGYCFPAAVNSGLMVLEPSTAVFRRAFDGLQNRSRFKPRRNDKSDQDVWRVLLPTVHGLLIGYNALKYANLVSPAEWSQIHVLHDAWQNRGSRWWNRGNGSAVYTEVMRLSRQSDKYLWARANASASSARADGLWWRSESDQKWIRRLGSGTLNRILGVVAPPEESRPCSQRGGEGAPSGCLMRRSL